MAAGGTAGNIDLGPGRVYYAPLGTAEPTSCSAALPSAWQVIGYTEDGTTIEGEITSEAVEVAEELDPIRYVMTRRAFRLSFQMAEMTIKRLALSLGAGTNYSDIAQGFEPPTPDQIVPVMFVWDRLDVPDATNRRWLFRQCTPSGTISVQRRKAPQKGLLPITFNVEKPSAAQPLKVFANSTGGV